MHLKQATLDKVRHLNKRFTNRVLIQFAGGTHSPFTILTHQGRKTGVSYSIPVIAMPVEQGFVFALTYGKEVDWLKNVMAKGGCSIKWKDKVYDLANPVLLERSLGLAAFPRLLRSILGRVGIEYFLKLTRNE